MPQWELVELPAIFRIENQGRRIEEVEEEERQRTDWRCWQWMPSESKELYCRQKFRKKLNLMYGIEDDDSNDIKFSLNENEDP